MSVIEMKREISQRLESYEDAKLLRQVLELLKFPPNYVRPTDATRHMEELFAENDGLLKRLA